MTTVQLFLLPLPVYLQAFPHSSPTRSSIVKQPSANLLPFSSFLQFLTDCLLIRRNIWRCRHAYLKIHSFNRSSQQIYYNLQRCSSSLRIIWTGLRHGNMSGLLTTTFLRISSDWQRRPYCLSVIHKLWGILQAADASETCRGTQVIQSLSR